MLRYVRLNNNVENVIKQQAEICIAIDVAKECAIACCFDNAIRKVFDNFKFEYSKSGFHLLIDLFNKIEEKGLTYCVVFESTGVYHIPLKLFLIKHNITSFIINTKAIKGLRMICGRVKKTDDLDLKLLAEFYFNHSNLLIRMYQYDDYELKELNRCYSFILAENARLKRKFKTILSLIYPKIECIFPDLFLRHILVLLEKYPHPEIALSSEGIDMIDLLKNNSIHTELYCGKLIEKFKKYCLGLELIISKDSTYCVELSRYSKLLLENTEVLKTALDEIVQKARENENYEIINSIPGLGENLTARLVAELGDMSRFDNTSKLMAYAGLDPITYQSGLKDGEHKCISKTGNARLRGLLYIACKGIIRLNYDNKITNFYKTKKLEGLNDKAAIVASMGKLLKVIYGMCKNGTMFES